MDADGTSFSESRIISIDAGSQLSHIVQRYGANTPIKVAAGIPLRNENDSTISSVEKGYVIYTEKSEKAGDVFVATVYPSGIDEVVVNTYAYDNPKSQNTETHTHVLGVTTYQPNTPIGYYTGYGWTKFGFNTVDDFKAYVENFIEAKANPLKVQIK